MRIICLNCIISSWNICTLCIHLLHGLCLIPINIFSMIYFIDIASTKIPYADISFQDDDIIERLWCWVILIIYENEVCNCLGECDGSVLARNYPLSPTSKAITWCWENPLLTAGWQSVTMRMMYNTHNTKKGHRQYRTEV